MYKPLSGAGVDGWEHTHLPQTLTQERLGHGLIYPRGRARAPLSTSCLQDPALADSCLSQLASQLPDNTVRACPVPLHSIPFWIYCPCLWLAI